MRGRNIVSPIIRTPRSTESGSRDSLSASPQQSQGNSVKETNCCNATKLTKGPIMNFNGKGNFDRREIIREFDATLMHLFGVNMLDAAISCQEALNAYSEVHCPHKAVEMLANRRCLNLLSPLAQVPSLSGTRSHPNTSSGVIRSISGRIPS